MKTISTKLVKDGNSVAVRLPKTVLKMSGLVEFVDMEVKDGAVVLRPSKPKSARSGWAEQIKKVKESDKQAQCVDSELDDWDMVISDGIE